MNPNRWERCRRRLEPRRRDQETCHLVILGPMEGFSLDDVWTLRIEPIGDDGWELPISAEAARAIMEDQSRAIRI